MMSLMMPSSVEMSRTPIWSCCKSSLIEPSAMDSVTMYSVPVCLSVVIPSMGSKCLCLRFVAARMFPGSQMKSWKEHQAATIGRVSVS